MAYEKGCSSCNLDLATGISLSKARFWEDAFFSSRFRLKTKHESPEPNKVQDMEMCADTNYLKRKQELSKQDEVKIGEICMNESHTVHAEKPLEVCRRYVGAIDTMNNERAFIGHSVESNYRSVVIGMVVHFDEQKGGRVVWHSVVPEIDYDDRNGFLTNSNIFFCSHTLAYVWSHRDSRKYSISGFCLSKNDQKPFTFQLRTEVDAPRQPAYMMMMKRWLCIRDEKAKHTVCYDLLSFRSMNDAQLIYDRAIVSNESLEGELSTLDVPAYRATQIEGYPLECAKCGNGTCNGKSRHGHLGRGYCVDCNILFCVFNKRWLCAQVVTIRSGNNQISFCRQALDANFGCDRPHLRECEYTVEKTYTTGKGEQRGVLVVLQLNKEADVEEGG